MRCPPGWRLLVLLAACDARISAGPSDNQGGTDAGADDAGTGSNDAALTDAGFGPWSAPAKILQAATAANEDDATLSSNAREMIFAIDAGKGIKHLFYTSRTLATDPWAGPIPVPFNSVLGDETPRFSPDDKTLYFASARANKGTLDIYSVKRDQPGSTTWVTVAPVGGVNTTAANEKWYMPCGGRYLMVQDNGANGTDFVEGAIGSAGTPVPELNSTANENGTFLTRDCLTVYFASNRVTPTMIYVSHRDTVDTKWKTPAPVVDFPISGGNGNQEDPWMSPDGHTFVFVSDASGSKDVYISTR